MNLEAIELVNSWQFPSNSIAETLLLYLADHADESLECWMTAEQIAVALEKPITAIDLILYTVGQQGRVQMIGFRADHKIKVGYKLVDCPTPAPAPMNLRDMPYDQYLTTAHWSMLRDQKLREADHRCQLCYAGDVELHVHHRTYKRRGAELLSDLTVLCAACHSMFHEHRELVR